MLPQLLATLLLMRRRGLEFMASAFSPVGSTTITKPDDVAVGDIVFAWAMDISASATMNTTAGDAWNAQDVSIAGGSTNGSATLFWKKLNATDVANAWTMSSAPEDGAQVFRYRSNGADTITVKDTTSNGSGTTTLTLDGFAKAAGHRATIAFFGAPDSTGAAGIVNPTGFTQRRKDSGTDASTTDTYVGIVCDTLGSYVDGAAVSFTNCDGNPAEYGVLVEVTGT